MNVAAVANHRGNRGIALSSCNRANDNDRAQEISGPGNQAGMSTIGDNKAAEAANASSIAAPADQEFANKAAASDNFEIASSRLADSNASSAAVKDFAREMIDAHTKSTAELKRIASALPAPITPDPSLSADQQGVIDQLSGKKGADFDRAYAAAQVDAHEKTLGALQSYGSGDRNAAFHGFVADIEPVVKKHLAMARHLPH